MPDEPKDTSAEETSSADAAAEPKGDATPPWRRQLDDSLGDLKTMAGDIRERLQRAGKSAQAEAKETWKKLEPQVHAAEEKLTEATDEAVQQLKGLFGQLQGKLANLRDKLG